MSILFCKYVYIHGTFRILFVCKCNLFLSKYGDEVQKGKKRYPFCVTKGPRTHCHDYWRLDLFLLEEKILHPCQFVPLLGIRVKDDRFLRGCDLKVLFLRWGVHNREARKELSAQSAVCWRQIPSGNIQV